MAKSKDRETVHSNRSAVQGDNERNKTPATVWINIRGTNKRGDLDGKLATVLDCLVCEHILEDDRLTILDTILTTFEISKKSGVDVVIIE